MVLTHIQALRAWAAISVILFHIGGSLASPVYFDFDALSYITRFGYVGMFVFFVLSGFIIHRVHADDIGRPERIIGYTKKRIFRIFPLYIFLLLVVSVFSKLSGIGEDGLPNDLTIILRTIFLLPQNPEIVGGTGAPIIIVAWSLQYEMIFYAIFALFIINNLLGIIVVAGLLFTWFFLHATEQYGTFPVYLKFQYFLFFIIGIVASIISRKGLSKSSAGLLRFSATLGFIVAFVVSTVLTISIQIYLIDIVSFQLALGGLAGLLILGLVEAERHGVSSAGTASCYLGNWSYAMYLVHFPVISGVNKILLFLGFDHVIGAIIALTVSLAITITAAVFLHEFIERPAMKFARS